MCAALWLFAGKLAAQPLEMKAQALPAGDLRELHLQARQTLVQGGATPRQLIALYEVIARAAARQGDEEAAGAAFMRLLALAPSYRLPSDEQDVVRSRYMEARGFWAAHTERLNVSARWSESASALLVSVIDPAQLCARVRVRWRKPGQSDYLETVRLPNAQIEVPMVVAPEVTELEVVLVLLDEHGNRMLERGTQEAPERLHVRDPAPIAASSAAANPPAIDTSKAVAPATASSSRRRRLLIASGISGGVAVLAGGGALWSYSKREAQAERWNSGRCDGSGVTRATLCADQREAVTRWQRVSIGLVATSGAALVGAALFSLLAPAQQERAAVGKIRASFHCHAGPGELGLGCAAVY